MPVVNPASEPYMSDHLLLLVGGNPLPVVVAGRVLVKAGGKITLIHTDKTKPIAEKAREWLSRNDRGISVNDLAGTDRLKRKEIHDTVRRVVQDKERGVGLHYTGGTAAMAVHARDAVRERAVAPLFSYLDATTLCLHFDDPSHKPIHVGTHPAFSITLEALFGLHGWHIHQMHDAVLLPAVAEALFQGYHSKNFVEHQEEGFIKRFEEDWKRRLNAKAKSGQGYKEEAVLQDTAVPYPAAAGLESLEQALRTEIPATPRNPKEFSLGQARSLGFDSAVDFCKWFDGAWLESWVMKVVIDRLKEKHALSGVWSGVRAGREARANKIDPEFDVVLLRGYQVFLISCTTERPEKSGARAMLKGKLFEAYVRARQLGGTEACVALVCFTDDTTIESEVQQALQVEGRVQVFGRRQLPALATHLSGWIAKQSREGMKCQ